MKRLLVIAMTGLCAGVFPARAAPPAMPQTRQTAGVHADQRHDAGARPSAMRRRGMRGMGCAPLLHDYYWLDYSRMGMRMRAAAGGLNGQSGQRMNRRMRILRLRHDGFPPRARAGCPACGKRGGGMAAMKAMNKTAPSLKGAWRGSGGRAAQDTALTHAALWLETPDNRIHRIDPKKPGVMRFNARMWGLHRIFAYLDAGVKNGARRRHFAFYDMFSHGDEVSKTERPVLNGGGYWKGQPEFFLERLYDNDRQRFSTQTGEMARFRVTLRGAPVKGACVVMVTQKGWRKALKTDGRGEVSFFIIKETPTGGGWRARRRSEKYLVAARHTAAGNGEKIRYSATTVLRVRPSRREWESKSTAFLVASFTVVAAGAAIAIRRSRRKGRRAKGGART